MRKIKEVWKRIRLHPSTKGKMRTRYEVSNLGRIRSIRQGTEPYVLQLGQIGGYLVFNMTVIITEEGERVKRNRYLHRIVAEYFCKDFDPDKVVIHLDHNKLNNDFRNLECVSHQEAIAHRKSVEDLPDQFITLNKLPEPDFEDLPVHRIKQEDEVFKLMEGYGRYEISNKGRIRKKPGRDKLGRRSRGHNMEMKQRIHPKENFYFLDLINDLGKRVTVYPHKEVAKAFCINVLPGDRTVVVHLDGDTLNNNSSNLDWATYSEAIKLQFKQGKKNNYKVWEKRKKLYRNGFKPKKKDEGKSSLKVAD
ncbi:hypothetical protein FUAX_12910 [Fulvitalea axinellae]|uniref:HNH endonuclease n=1 Tax=Fulvitalea axinellae TaxID=1182444 RepID=A0AAU9CR02_9BACT|nr:hypothetical protein FUAX_12910 [Fulvitalea axinellae]